jgi:hypothetical protein
LNENSIAEKVYLTDIFSHMIELWIVKMQKKDTKKFNFIDFLNQISKTKILCELVNIHPNGETNDYVYDILFNEKNVLYKEANQQLNIFFKENTSLREFYFKDRKTDVQKQILPFKIQKRNIELPVHTLLLDFCIAFLPLNLPAYVLLWIFDWLPDCFDFNMSHCKKIALIIKTIEFYRNKNNKVLAN